MSPSDYNSGPYRLLSLFGLRRVNLLFIIADFTRFGRGLNGGFGILKNRDLLAIATVHRCH